ncbi:hypothetical protein PCE1_002546 [Barthelona sp. PCE]
MPRKVTQITDRFTFTDISGRFAVNGTDNHVFNTTSFKFIDKYEDRGINSAAIEAGYLSNNFDDDLQILKPSLLDPDIFYRSYEIGNDMFRIDIFKYIDKLFEFVANHDFPLKREWEYIRLLTARFWIERSSLIVFDLENSVEIDDFKLYNNVLRMKFIVQNGIPFMYHFSEPGTTVIRRIMFDEEGIPRVDSDILSINVFAIDNTPGDSHFIVEQHGQQCTFIVDDGKVVTTPIRFVIPCLEKNEFLRISGAVLALDRLAETPNVECELSNFVILDDEMHCSVYNNSTGSTMFFPMYISNMSCLFFLDRSSRFCFSDNPSNFISTNHLKSLPIYFDFFNNLLTFFNPVEDQYNLTLCNRGMFYDLCNEKWQMYCLVENNHQCHVFINNTKAHTFSRNDSRYEFSCNNHHCASLLNNNEVHINNVQFSGESIHLVGNYLWIYKNRTLTIVCLDQKTSEVKTSSSHTFNRKIEVIVKNPYCPSIIFVGLSRRGRFCVRYDEESNELSILEDLPVEADRWCGEAIFIDKNLLLYNTRLFKLNKSGIENFWDLPIYSSNWFKYSPEIGFLMMHAGKWDNFSLPVYILACPDDEIIVEQRQINVIEFISTCNMASTISCFGAFTDKVL